MGGKKKGRFKFPPGRVLAENTDIEVKVNTTETDTLFLDPQQVVAGFVLQLFDHNDVVVTDVEVVETVADSEKEAALGRVCSVM